MLSGEPSYLNQSFNVVRRFLIEFGVGDIEQHFTSASGLCSSFSGLSYVPKCTLVA